MSFVGQGDRILVAGYRGLVGSAIVRELRAQGFESLLLWDRAEVDLTDQAATRRMFEKHRPQFVLQAAARVGGILANETAPAQFIHQNLVIQTNVIHESWRVGARRLLFLGSSCIYPRHCPQPMREVHLLTGPLEPTNQPYAVAKIAGIEMCRAYNREYGTSFLSVMPTNLYGPGDNFDPVTSHVLPALLHKMHRAKTDGAASVTLWGTGSPRREFLYSADLAAALVFLLRLPEALFAGLIDHPEAGGLVNIGCGEDLTIRELADRVRHVVGFEGKIVWDSSKPDGTARKLLDLSRLRALGWQPRTPLDEGIHRLYDAYLARS